MTEQYEEGSAEDYVNRISERFGTEYARARELLEEHGDAAGGAVIGGVGGGAVGAPVLGAALGGAAGKAGGLAAESEYVDRLRTYLEDRHD